MTEKNILTNRSGFTLIEMIMVLTIAGIGALAIGMGAVKITEGFIFSRDNMHLLQKGNLAMSRMVSEFTNINSVTASNYAEDGQGKPTLSSVNFTTQHTAGVGGTVNDAIIWNVGGDLMLGVDILSDQVSTFRLTYYDSTGGLEGNTWTGNSSIIEISLTLIGVNGVAKTFNTRVVPRNI